MFPQNLVAFAITATITYGAYVLNELRSRSAPSKRRDSIAAVEDSFASKLRISDTQGHVRRQQERMSLFGKLAPEVTQPREPQHRGGA